MKASFAVLTFLIFFVAFWLYNNYYYSNQEYERLDRARRKAAEKDA